MSALNALTPRTRRRHAHRKRPPILVSLDKVSLQDEQNQPVLDGLDFQIRAGERWQVFCDSHLLRTRFLQCVAGVLPPASGTVTIRGHVSWPLGQLTGLNNRLSCAENSRFLAGIYGQLGRKEEHHSLVRQLCAFSVKRWSEPLKHLDGASRQRFRLALSLAFDFDLYVLDPSAFRSLGRPGTWTEPWQATLDRRLRERAVITLAPDELGLGVLCRRGLVLEHGRLLVKGSLERCQAFLAERPPQKRAMEA